MLLDLGRAPTFKGGVPQERTYGWTYEFGSTEERTCEFGSTYKRTYECSFEFWSTYKFGSTYERIFKRSYVRFLAPGAYLVVSTKDADFFNQPISLFMTYDLSIVTNDGQGKYCCQNYKQEDISMNLIFGADDLFPKPSAPM